MTKWRGKIRYGISIVFMLLILLVAGTYVTNRMTENYVITQQKAIIGSLYEKDPALCEEFLFLMFETEKEVNPKSVEKALVKFGYTQEGVEYLYTKNELKHNGEILLLVQIGLSGAILLCIWKFLRIQENKMEHQMNVEVGSVMVLSEKETAVAKEMAQKFVENIAHQIKTPLACISLSLDMLQEGLQGEHEKEKVTEAFVYLKQIEVLMKRLLDIGRLESGKQMLKKEAISIEELLQSCVKQMDAKGDRILLEVVRKCEEEPVFYGDYDWLREAFCNLLKNALEHDASQSEINVSLRLQEERIVVQIRDHGEGIRPEDKEHIFDRFYIPNHAKKGHTGIGLNLAKLVVEKHFGTIEAVNHDEGGVVIRINFPNYGMKNKKM